MYIKQINEEIDELFPHFKGDTKLSIETYIINTLNKNGVTIYWDRLIPCPNCFRQNIEFIKREDHYGMCGGWVNYYHIECKDCGKKTKEIDDWTNQDYTTQLIKLWNNGESI